MQGYGQQVIQNEQLAQALANQQMQMNRQQSAQSLMNPSGAGGLADVLGAALGGFMNKKKGDEIAQGGADIEKQIAQIQAESQKAIEAKKHQQADMEYKQKFDSLVNSGLPPEKANLVARGIASYKDFQEKAPDQTTAVKNALSMGLQQGSPEFNDYIMKTTGKAGTTVNVNPNGSPEIQTGKIPDGFALTRDPQTGVPRLQRIEGSEQLEEKENEVNTQQRKVEGSFADFSNIDNVLNKTMSQVGINTAGMGGQLMGMFAGSEASDLRENLKTIEADAAFSSLQNMRDNSKTGGALGQVSERELGLLSSAKAALSQSQSPEQLKENLARYQQVRKQAMMRTAEAYKQDFGSYPKGFESNQEQPQQTSTQVQQMSDEELMRALNGG